MLLELKNVKKYFPIQKGFLPKAREYVRAVDGVDLTLNTGENLGLVGESGCGKTTLGRMILKLIPADSGQIIFEGADISRLPNGKMRPIRQHMQMVFQDPYSSLDPRFTVRDILLEAMILDRSRRRHKEARAIELLRSVRLEPGMMNRFAHEFSGGERQRIAIARALAMNPKLLILDEAVSSLDVLVQGEIIQLLQDLQQEFRLTYIFISHNLRVVKKLCRRIAVMYQGKIVELAPTAEIFNNPLHPYTKQLLSAALHYRAEDRSEEEMAPQKSSWIDAGGGHWVMVYS